MIINHTKNGVFSSHPCFLKKLSLCLNTLVKIMENYNIQRFREKSDHLLKKFKLSYDIF